MGGRKAAHLSRCDLFPGYELDMATHGATHSAQRKTDAKTSCVALIFGFPGDEKTELFRDLTHIDVLIPYAYTYRYNIR